MRILIIHNRYGPTARGGAERVVERLVGELAGRGHEVHVAAVGIGNVGSELPGRLHALRAPNLVPFARLHRLPAPLRVLWHAGDIVNPVASWSLARLLRAMRPDVVHTHNLVGCGGLAFWVIRRSGIPHVHTLHDVQLLTPSGIFMGLSPNTIPAAGSDVRPESLRHSLAYLPGTPSERTQRFRLEPRSPRDGSAFVDSPLMGDRPSHALERSFLGSWYRSLRRSLAGSPTIVAAPSRWLLDRHRAAGFFPRSEQCVIGNPVALPAGAPHRSGAVRRFLFVGQLEGAKGVHVLVEAFRRIRSMFPDTSLQVVGDGALTAALRREVRSARDVVLRGSLDATGVSRAMANADVLVVPSLVQENQPSVILEAFAVGLPVVATRVGGVPELVADGVTGFLVDPGSVDDCTRALRIAVEQPTIIREMRVACQAVAATHAVGRIVDQYEAVYTRGAQARASAHAP